MLLVAYKSVAYKTKSVYLVFTVSKLWKDGDVMFTVKFVRVLNEVKPPSILQITLVNEYSHYC